MFDPVNQFRIRPDVRERGRAAFVRRAGLLQFGLGVAGLKTLWDVWDRAAPRGPGLSAEWLLLTAVFNLAAGLGAGYLWRTRYGGSPRATGATARRHPAPRPNKPLLPRSAVRSRAARATC